jgi:predicted kinase
LTSAIHRTQDDDLTIAEFPEPSLVVLVGPIASGKSTWAQTRFRRNEIVSLARLQGAVGRDDYDRQATRVAYELLERIVDVRLERELTVVIDTDGLDDGRRSRWLAAAEAHSIAAVAVFFSVDVETCLARNSASPNPRPDTIVKRQAARCSELGPRLASAGFQVREITNGPDPATEMSPAGES